VRDRSSTDKTTDSAADRTLSDLFGEPVSAYTREQPLADGVLVDVTSWASSGPDGMLGGFTLPVVITRPLWDLIDIDPLTGYEPRCRQLARARGESTRGRSHDVLWLASVAARRAGDSHATQYSVLMTMEGTNGTLARQTLY